MKLFLTSALFLGISASPALAMGGWSGNGGDGVYCGESTPVELLDIYEARTMRGWNFEIPEDSSVTVEAQIEKRLRKLERLDPMRVAHFRLYAAGFMAEAQFVDARLVDIPDSQHIVVPEGCRIDQVAIQREPELPGDKRYVISRPLWDLMDNTSKAGLILHEIIYRDVLRLNHDNSKAARYFTAMILSTQIEEINSETYVSTLKSLNFLYFAVKGLLYSFEKPSQKFYPHDCTPVKLPDQYQSEAVLDLYENGSVKEGELLCRQMTPIGGRGLKIPVMKNIQFHENGRVKSSLLWNEVLIDIGDRRIALDGEYYKGKPVSFHTNGILKSGTLRDETTFETSNGSEVLVGAGVTVELNELGQLISNN